MRAAVLIAVALALAGCGESRSSDRVPGSTTTSTSNPITGAGAQVVEPRPGMTGVHPIRFDTVSPRPDGLTLAVDFTGGVAPCFVLDHVDVDETPDAVTITLYAGQVPSPEPVACIEIAAFYETLVTLDAQLGGRPVVDGAPG